MLPLLDALVYSSLWVAAAAALLAAAAARALGNEPAAAVWGLASLGTLVVYNVDRLRDLERDRATTPRRSDFVLRHRTALRVLSGGAALGALALGFTLGLRVALLLAPVLLIGLLHRRLKGLAWAKTSYVTLAWVTVVVGLPWLIGPRAEHALLVAAVMGTTVFANVMASNVRDGETAAPIGPRLAIQIARGLAALGSAAALLAPADVRPLAAVPLATLLALLRFRASERYGLFAVDGALVAGAAIALVLLRAP